MYFLGIDGGGTKTDFKVIDENNTEIFRLTLPEGSKPTYYGVEHAVRVLKQGLDAATETTDSIDALYAGIAGCALRHDIHEPIRELFNDYCTNYELAGDLLTSFRSASSGPYGMVLLCGSGSGIAHWYPNGFVNLDAVAYGARELLLLVSHTYKHHQFSKETEHVLFELLGKELLNGNAHYFLTHTTPTHLLKELTPKTLPAPAWRELHKVFDIAIERWVYKGIGRILWHQSHTVDRPTEVVLVGGIWNFDYIRENVIEKIEEALDNSVLVLYDPHRKPVDGATQLARELYDPSYSIDKQLKFIVNR